jgi:hypothetical protein
MIEWTKITESHVIKTFRKICSKWWGIDIQFYDEYGVCKKVAYFPKSMPPIRQYQRVTLSTMEA